MGETRLDEPVGRVARVLRLREGEGRLAAALFGLMLVAQVANTVGGSGISAIFFERVGADAVPLMYVLQGTTAFTLMLGLTAVLGKLGPRKTYTGLPLALAALLLAERVVLMTDVSWIYAVMWVTIVVGNLIQTIVLWGTAGAVVDTRQAKRLFPIFGAGGVLGSVVGGISTAPLARLLGAENLLLVWIGGLVVAFLLCRRALRRAPAGGRLESRRHISPIREMAASFAFVRRSRLLVWMTVTALLISLLFYSLYLPYAAAASEQFPDADDLAGFFGLFWAGVTLVATVVSILFTNRLFTRFGVGVMVILLPLLYTSGFGILLVESGFVMLVAVRFAMGVWLQGVALPGWETLINVAPDQRRDPTRAFLMGGPTQLGTVTAGVVALIAHGALTTQQFAGVGLIIALVTIGATTMIRRSYPDALRDALRAGRPDVFDRAPARETPVALACDADSVAVLLQAMRSKDVHVRRLAYQIVAALPSDLRPPGLIDGAGDEDPIVRLAVVRGLDCSAQPERDAVETMTTDTDASVAGAAAARAIGWTDDERPVSRLLDLLGDQEERVRRMTLDQLSLAPASRAAALSERLLTDASPSVRAAALERFAAAAPERALDHTVAGLNDPDPTVRVAAGRALGALGSDGLEAVLSALEDPVTAEAAVDAIRRMEQVDADERIREYVRSATTRALRDRELAASIPSNGDEAVLLRDALLQRGRRTARTALVSATLLANRRVAMETAIDNLDGPSGQTATALETLEATGDPRLVRPLLLLWEPMSTPTVATGDWLRHALGDEDPFIRGCAELIRTRQQGDGMSSATGLSLIERVLFLRQVPLFAELELIDLQRIAEIAEERGYVDGELIAEEGEFGHDLHIVVEGTIRVVKGRDGSQRELARRTASDVVGEMSIIMQTPRIAALVADGVVRTVCIGHRDFQSMVRERPEVAFAVMRVLSHRLAEEARPPEVAETWSSPGS